MMRIAHYTWCLAAIAYIWNAFVITCAIFAGVGGINASDWLVALTFAGAGVPLSRWGWYGALVSAARRTQRDVAQTAAYGRFFIHFGIHCLAVVFAMIAGLLFKVIDPLGLLPDLKNLWMLKIPENLTNIKSLS